MKNGIGAVLKWTLLLIGVGLLANCGSERSQATDTTAGRAGGQSALLAPNGITGRGVLRSATDLARGRLWVLTLEDVQVYDFRSRRLIRKIVLPSWSVANDICMPDLALDRSGSAWVSSNVQSRLWRIGADDFNTSEHEIRLQDRERWEVGFGALTFGADGTLFALTASAVSLWKIDVGQGSARMIELDVPLMKVCDLAGLLGAVADKGGKTPAATIRN